VEARIAAEAAVELRKARVKASEPRPETAKARVKAAESATKAAKSASEPAKAGVNASPETAKAGVEAATAPEAAKSAPEAPKTSVKPAPGEAAAAKGGGQIGSGRAQRRADHYGIQAGAQPLEPLPRARRIDRKSHMITSHLRAGLLAPLRYLQRGWIAAFCRMRISKQPVRKAKRAIEAGSGFGWLPAGDALFRKERRKFARLEHLARNVAAAHKFSRDIELGNCRPIGKILDSLAHFVACEAIHGFIVHAQIIQDLHDLARKAALWKVRRAFHEQDHLVVVDCGLNFILDGHP
jgi:hypothetical protein